jgi:CubicO group peptidase (beta-lactamase class C family)
MERIRLLRSICILSIVLLAATAVRADRDANDPLPTANPASQGFSADRLERLHARMKRFVDEGEHAGIVTLIARNGRIVDWRAWGYRDIERKLPMEKDTIVRIYSMTKIIASVAAMVLHEEGRLKLEDPVAKYLPAFSSPKVFKGGTAAAPVLVPAKTPITIKHLLTHTSGYRYGFADEPLDRIYKKAAVLDATSMDDFVTRAAKLPLAHEPGTRFSYGINTDIVGAVIEKVSGQKFDDFVEERISKPLSLRDTGFDVPASKLNRLANMYEHAKKAKAGSFVVSKPMGASYVESGFAAGGSGMFSTIGDYARIAQMLLNGGELDGARILGRKTVELMTANHLGHLARPTTEFSDSDGFGLGVAVRLDLARSNQLGSVGQFGWSGAATTTVIIDPGEKLIALVFAQHLPFNEHDLFWQFNTLTYQALVD